MFRIRLLLVALCHVLFSLAPVTIAAAEECSTEAQIAKYKFRRGAIWTTCARSKLVFQYDGNLVIYDASDRPIWASNTWGTGATEFAFADSGNLIIYRNGVRVWDAGTAGNPDAVAMLKDDGELIVRRPDGTSLFTSRPINGPNQSAGPLTQACTNSPEIIKGEYQAPAIWRGCNQRRLAFQNDGNLVVYDATGTPVWSSNTWGTGADRLVFQEDGNLLIYRSNAILWQAHTAAYPGAVARFHQDGSLVVNDRNGNQIFSTHTSAESSRAPKPCQTRVELAKGEYALGTEWKNCASTKLIFQSDGNLVVYDSTGKPTWASNTIGVGATKLAIQADGNMAIYKQNVILWQSRTTGHSGTTAFLDEIGRVAIYSTAGQTLFASNLTPDQ